MQGVQKCTQAIKQSASRGNHPFANLEPTTTTFTTGIKIAYCLLVHLRLFADVFNLRQLHARPLLLGVDFNKAGQRNRVQLRRTPDAHVGTLHRFNLW